MNTSDEAFTPREVAELSGAPRTVIEKAMEDRIIGVRAHPGRVRGRRGRRLLPLHAVAYARLVSRLKLTLSATHKKRLAHALAEMEPGNVRSARFDLEPAVEIDVGRLVGDTMERAESYRTARDAFIVIDEEIKGGTPVIRGTRMTVYSVLGRVDHGDTVEEILEENPDIAREAVEAAIIYARTHPFLGRPGGRPWERGREAVHR